jgi:hypothetical protein
MTLLVSTLSALVTTATLAIDVALVILVDNRLSDDIDVASGTAGWMVPGAAIALWLTVVISMRGMVRMRRMHKDHGRDSNA